MDNDPQDIIAIIFIIEFALIALCGACVKASELCKGGDV